MQARRFRGLAGADLPNELIRWGQVSLTEFSYLLSRAKLILERKTNRYVKCFSRNENKVKAEPILDPDALCAGVVKSAETDKNKI